MRALTQTVLNRVYMHSISTLQHDPCRLPTQHVYSEYLVQYTVELIPTSVCPHTHICKYLQSMTVTSDLYVSMTVCCFHMHTNTHFHIVHTPVTIILQHLTRWCYKARNPRPVRVAEWVECLLRILEDREIWRSRVWTWTSQFSNPGRVKWTTLKLILVTP